MTFIVALQLEDGVALASDTRAFQLNDHYQLQAVMNTVSQKSQLWDLGIFASNGIDQIGQTVYKKLCQNHEIKLLPMWLQQSAKDFAKVFSGYPILDEQIICTQIYCSTLIDNKPQLFSAKQAEFEYFLANEVRLMTYQKDLTLIMPSLLQLQQNILPRHQFIDEVSWMQYYLKYFQTIFYQMNKADNWVSQDFHVYFDNGIDRFFGYIPNNKNCQIRFDI
jgi:hypothetical protein